MNEIHIPARRKQHATESQITRLTTEAYNCLVDIYNDSSLSMTQIASKIIIESMDRIVYDKED